MSAKLPCTLLFCILALACGGLRSPLEPASTAPPDNPNATLANFRQLKSTMSLAGVERVLGPGTRATMTDLRGANYGKLSSEVYKVQQEYGPPALAGALYRWRHADDWIFVVFDKAPRGDDGRESPDARATGALWIGNVDGTINTQTSNLP